MDEAAQTSLRSDVNLYLGTRGRGQWFTAEQLYAALGLASRSTTVSLEEFHAFLRDLANRKVIHRWRSEQDAARGEMFGIP